MVRSICLAAALALAGALPAAAQTVSPSPSPGSPGGNGSAGSGGVTMPRAVTNGGASEASAPAPSPTAQTPGTVTQPNNAVPPSAATLPGGGGNVPGSPATGVGQSVPLYGTRDNANRPLTESERRSSNVECGGEGTRSTSGSGLSSAQTTPCAEPSPYGALGTRSIMVGGANAGPVDVSQP